MPHCIVGQERQKPRPPPYLEELQEKEKRVQQLLNGFDITDWKPILPSPEPWYYRNKMELAFAAETVPPPPPRSKPGEPPLERPRDYPDVEGVRLGLREAGRFDRIVDLETCLLMSPETENLIHRVRAWARRHNLSGYDRHCHRGRLRYLVVREGKNTGQRMVILITSASPGLRPPSRNDAGLGQLDKDWLLEPLGSPGKWEGLLGVKWAPLPLERLSGGWPLNLS